MVIAMKILATATLLILLMASNAHATEQAPDAIIYRGQTFAFDHFPPTFPMELYFGTHPDKRPQGARELTCLARGYYATYEFQNNSLVLKDIETWVPIDSSTHSLGTTLKSVKNQIFPEGETLKIDWIIGILVLVHEDDNSLLTKTERTYVLLSVKNGNLMDERKFDSNGFAKFKDKQYQAFKKTEAYKQEVSGLKKLYLESGMKDVSQEYIDGTIRNSILGCTSEFLDEEIAPKNSGEKTSPSANPQH
jgi:hypothetical protein